MKSRVAGFEIVDFEIVDFADLETVDFVDFEIEGFDVFGIVDPILSVCWKKIEEHKI
jgi:hypothetical protein